MEYFNKKVDSVHKVFPLTLIDPQAIIAEYAKEHAIELAPNAQLLRKSRDLSSDLVKTAQERQERWRKNIQRVRDRQIKFAEVPDKIRTDQGLSARKIAEKQIREMQQKITEEGERFEKRIDKYEERRKIQQQLFKHRAALRQQEKNERTRIAQERVQQRKSEEITAEEFRNKFIGIKKERTNRAQAKSDRKSELLLNQMKKFQAERRENFQAFIEHLTEKVTAVDMIEEKAAKKAAYARSLLKAPEINFEEKREIVASIVKKGNATREEKMQSTMKHFERMKQRMIKIFESSHEHREKAIRVIYEITTNARRRAQASMLASGHPSALREVLTDIDYFKIIREHTDGIINDSDNEREESVEEKRVIVENARERSAANMLASGNPKALFQALSTLEYFQHRDKREILDIIKNARERSDYNNNLSGLPAKKRKKVIKLLHRMLGYMSKPAGLLSSARQNILAISRKNPALILRSLVEHVTMRMMEVQSSYEFTRSIEASLEKEMRRDEVESFNEINLVLKQENLRSLFSGLLIDKALKANDLITRYHLDAEPQADSFIAHFIYAFQHETLGKYPFLEKQPAPPINDLVSSLDNTLTNTTNYCYDDIYTILECPLAYFDSLDHEGRANLGEDIFPFDKPIPDTEYEDTSREKAANAEKQRGIKANETHRLQSEDALREYYKRLIEEQNLTAHEKMNNESNLIDFFF